jgi:hypothetical protein
MEITNFFPLITGTFKIADARSIIQNLYHQKILYHNLQLARIRECNNGNLEEVEQKIDELENNRKAISLFFLAYDDNLQVKINGNIEVSVNIPAIG